MTIKLGRMLATAGATLVAMTASAGIADVTPIPAQMTPHKGIVRLDSTARLVINAPQADASRLRAYADANLGRLGAAPRKKSPTVTLSLVDRLPGVDSPEGYTLSVNRSGVTARATSGAGLYYALTTLRQLAKAGNPSAYECVDITDSPRFPYRGMMLDISRHYRDKDFILKQIDAIAALKLNRLHLHLTDGAGWRLEIKRYPRLTDYAAWRPQEVWKDWSANGHKYVERTDSSARGGYLTQDEAREIVAYAADRFITVVPEIEMPSHSDEVTAAYPELSCTHDPNGTGDFCIGNEATHEFLQNVLSEVIDIFPSTEIHIGGDEAGGGNWLKCPLCEATKQKYGLKNNHELQAYMIARTGLFLGSHGRTLVGWDEITEAQLPDDAIVMSWRGTEGGIRAARAGHRAIMSPGSHCYLDSYQDAPPTQPEALSGYLPTGKVYSYNPAPDSLSADVRSKIIGVQGNLWTEYVPTPAHAEYMLYPRMIAIAEIGWSPQERRDSVDFRRRAIGVADRMRSQGYNTFDLRREVGERPESLRPESSIAIGKPVTYNIPWWTRYHAAEGATLTDGLRGGWTYSDRRWQGFLPDGGTPLDVTVDLGAIIPVTYIGAEFMQITGPDVWWPEHVTISVSDDGITYRTLSDTTAERRPTTGLHFKTFDWSGDTRTRYVRYQATAPSGCLFTDEIIIR